MNISKPPWIHRIRPGFCDAINSNENKLIAMMHTDNDDAKLIAAAPEMFYLLKELVDPNNLATELEAREKATELICRLEDSNETEKPDSPTMGNGNKDADHQP